MSGRRNFAAVVTSPVTRRGDESDAPEEQHNEEKREGDDEEEWAAMTASPSPRMTAAFKRSSSIAPSLSSMGRTPSMFRHRMSLDMRKSTSWHNESDADILAPSGAIPVRLGQPRGAVCVAVCACLAPFMLLWAHSPMVHAGYGSTSSACRWLGVGIG